MDIETRRLLLRPLRDEDAAAIAAGFKNYNVTKNTARVPFPYTEADAEAFIKAQRGFAAPSKTFAITFKCAPDELIGVISYEASLELGYWLRECCWRMGIMSEAASALVQHAIMKDGLTELHAGYHVDNPNSGRILRKLGFAETHQAMNFSLAQGKDVLVQRAILTKNAWLQNEKGRAN